jgi:hypothetical protein
LPVQGFALQIALMLLSVLFAATVLFAWRQSGAGHTASWVCAWLFVLLVQSFVWHWRHRICCELWAAGRDRWAGIPDEPWHLPRRMWSWIRRFRASRGARGDADADGIPPQRPDAAT